MLITPLFAALFALLFLVLSIAVIRQRIRTETSLGAGQDPELEKAIRIHANFSEYVPLALLLMWFVEMMTAMHLLVAVLGCALLLGRICHIIGMLDHARFKFRQIGVLATFIVIAVCALLLLWTYLSGNA
ncbi:MAG: glutathione metabolism protein [Gammaproteobacteria bacterium]|nr:glutathione metabolism protein [Gammaproteobacteria bacterium]